MVRTRSAAWEAQQDGSVDQQGVQENQLQHTMKHFAAPGVFKSAPIDVPAKVNMKRPTANSVKSEPQIVLPLPPPLLPKMTPPAAPSVKSGKSSVVSFQARRKRLELQAAARKAKIAMDLIDKQLEADIAELDDEFYSPQNEDQNNVEPWLESNSKTLENGNIEQQPLLPPCGAAAPATTQLTVGNPHPAAGECIAGTTARLPHDYPEPQTAPLPPPPYLEPAVTAQATVTDMLSSTLRDIATAACANSNANLISRLSTPRDLPEFSGDPMEWLYFKQAYEESTELCNFSPKENLWRLRKCLRGAAKETVSAMLISATSPDIIISTLKLRFGNPEIIIWRILQDLKKLPPVSPEYQSDIIVFACKVMNFIEAVRAVKRDEYLQGIDIASIILYKLPAVLLSKWSDYSFPLINEGRKPRLVILADFLNLEALKVSTTSSIYCPALTETKFERHINHSLKSQTVLFPNKLPDSVYKCNFCNFSYHKITDCKRFKNALRKVRWQYVKGRGFCYKCLITRHPRETCPAPVCDKDGCGAAHHRLLHFDGNNSKRKDSAAAAKQQSDSSDSVRSVETMANVNAIDNQVLKVVPVRVHGSKSISATTLLDEDESNVSLISSKIKLVSESNDRMPSPPSPPHLLRVRRPAATDGSTESTQYAMMRSKKASAATVTSATMNTRCKSENSQGDSTDKAKCAIAKRRCNDEYDLSSKAFTVSKSRVTPEQPLKIYRAEELNIDKMNTQRLKRPMIFGDGRGYWPPDDI